MGESDCRGKSVTGSNVDVPSLGCDFSMDMTEADIGNVRFKSDTSAEEDESRLYSGGNCLNGDRRSREPRGQKVDP